MARAIWKGRIAFGLVSVPVTLQTAERKTNVQLQLIDSRNASPVRYKRVNELTGEEVPWDKIVKGYEYNDRNYVLLSERELEQTAAELTRTVEIEQFVDGGEIDSVYFERPYYLVPDKGGEKGYRLLREAMARTGKAGIAKVVIHTRQYLAAMLPREEAIVLNLLRFQDELRPLDELEIPQEEGEKNKLRAQELDLAVKLIEGMTEKWNPAAYRDEYRDALLGMIQKKIDAGQFEPVSEVRATDSEKPAGGVINLMDALKQSLARSGKSKATRPKPAARTARRGKKRAS